VVREVRNGERDGRETRIVVASRTYATTVDDTWDALTSAERVARWFMPLSGDLRVGGRFQLEGNAGGEILQCQPPSHLEVTWEFGQSLSWLDVKLRAEGKERTRLDLEHTVPVDDHWKKFGPGAVGLGWEIGLFGLGRHFATKASVDPNEAMAWTASAEGKAFLRESSDAWCRAWIAGGADAAEATACAARTLAAYAGEPSPS
jgi:uncharacterized protein YndB with AHSA1/START domain